MPAVEVLRPRTGLHPIGMAAAGRGVAAAGKTLSARLASTLRPQLTKRARWGSAPTGHPPRASAHKRQRRVLPPACPDMQTLLVPVCPTPNGVLPSVALR
jgi:hypothetical protein